MPLSESERRLRASRAGLAGWANTVDRSARGRKANAGLQAKWERTVDPDGTMDPAERAKRVATLRKKHYADMAWKATKARQAKAKARRDAAAAMRAERDAHAS